MVATVAVLAEVRVMVAVVAEVRVMVAVAAVAPATRAMPVLRQGVVIHLQPPSGPTTAPAQMIRTRGRFGHTTTPFHRTISS